MDDVMSYHFMQPTEVCDWITQERRVLYLHPPGVETQWHISTQCVLPLAENMQGFCFCQLSEHKAANHHQTKHEGMDVGHRHTIIWFFDVKLHLSQWDFVCAQADLGTDMSLLIWIISML